MTGPVWINGVAYAAEKGFYAGTQRTAASRNAPWSGSGRWHPLSG